MWMEKNGGKKMKLEQEIKRTFIDVTFIMILLWVISIVMAGVWK